MSELKSPYNRWNVLEGKEQVDFYDLINLLESNGESIPVEIAHALKKIMYVGQRGHKALVQDMREAVWSIERFLENIGTDDEEDSVEELTETPESTFEINSGSSTLGYTRSGEWVVVFHAIVDGKLGVWPLFGRGLGDDNLLCKVDAKTFRVNTATDIDHPYDLMSNELPTFIAEGE